MDIPNAEPIEYLTREECFKAGRRSKGMSMASLAAISGAAGVNLGGMIDQELRRIDVKNRCPVCKGKCTNSTGDTCFYCNGSGQFKNKKKRK